MKREHGTIKNYVIGFVLSLVFTLIPYFLAVNRVYTGTVLFGVIVAFALVQALIQILFFLHLGRERKPHWQAGFLVMTAGAIFVVTVATIWIMYHLQGNMTPTQEELQAFEDEGIAQIGGAQACSGDHATLMVTIKDGVVSPAHTNAKACDSIMFMNEDNVSRDITYGVKGDPGTYGGQSDFALASGQDKTVLLNELGTQSFYDDLHSGVTGNFTVSQ